MCPFHHTSGATQLAKTPEEGGSYTPFPRLSPILSIIRPALKGALNQIASSIRHTMSEEQLTILRGGGGTRDECGNCKDVWEVVGTKDRAPPQLSLW